jgi:integrase
MARKHGQDRGLKPVTRTDGKVWWQARLYHQGNEWRSKAVPTKKEARDIYTAKKAELREAEYFPAVHQAKHAQQITVADLMALVVQDYRREGRRTLKEAIHLAAFWNQLAGTKKASEITGSTLKAWADQWLDEGLAPSTINNKIGKLLRGYQLACDEEPPLLFTRPKWKNLAPGPPRSGWMEFPTFELVRELVPTWCRVPITIAYWTGMRMGEIFALRWPQVVLYHESGRVAFHLDRTKNKELRAIVWTGDLYRTLSEWETISKELATLCPWVCHRQGKGIGTIDTAWKTACVKLKLATGTWLKGKGYWIGYHGPLLHDFRRTAVRNLDRSGVSRDIARKITGHKTDSIYSRYNIVSDEDLAEAGSQVVDYIERLHGTGRKPESHSGGVSGTA